MNASSPGSFALHRACLLAAIAVLFIGASARADDLDAETQELIERLPEALQPAAQQMAESRDPAPRFIATIFELPRARLGSGTSWQPDASPLYSVIPTVGRWGLMVHGNLYTGYNWYGSKRGGQRFMGRNTLMGSLFRTFKKSEVLLRLALSFEPLTIGSRGYPLILQTGQTRDGAERLHDRQYALDFFRELAVLYTWHVTPRWAASVYAAAAGEPAVGPNSFTQRVSASPDPIAPLGFQLQESSHSSFGVLTVGAFTRTLKLEASWFNGRVPGSRRYGIYIRKPDSYSVRVSWNPAPEWSGQVSYAFFEEPVPLEPKEQQHRLSGSVSHTMSFAGDLMVASTLSGAMRVRSSIAGAALLGEIYLNLRTHHAIYGRFEILQKSGIELELSRPAEPTRELHAVGTLALGYVYYFGPFISLSPGLGVRGSVSPVARELERDYGTRAPLGVMVYAQLRTAAMPSSR